MFWRIAIAAAKARGATDTLIESTSNDNRAPFRSAFGNGSLPTEKPHKAIATKRSAAVTALRRLPRKPAHINGSKIRKPRRLRYGSGTLRPLMRSLPTSGLYATIPIMLAGAFKCFFGREFLVNGMSCDIAVDSVLDTLGQVEAITLRPIEAASSKPRSLGQPFSLRWMLEVSLLEFRGIYFQVLQSSMGQARSKPSWQLRHGIYNHPNCVDGIVRWLRRVT